MTAKSDRDLFLDFLGENFGTEERILKHQPKSGPTVHAFVFRDYPEAGRLTAVPYGLSHSAITRTGKRVGRRS